MQLFLEESYLKASLTLASVGSCNFTECLPKYFTSSVCPTGRCHGPCRNTVRHMKCYCLWCLFTSAPLITSSCLCKNTTTLTHNLRVFPIMKAFFKNIWIFTIMITTCEQEEVRLSKTDGIKAWNISDFPWYPVSKLTNMSFFLFVKSWIADNWKWFKHDILNKK